MWIFIKTSCVHLIYIKAYKRRCFHLQGAISPECHLTCNLHNNIWAKFGSHQYDTINFNRQTQWIVEKTTHQAPRFMFSLFHFYYLNLMNNSPMGNPLNELLKRQPTKVHVLHSYMSIVDGSLFCFFFLLLIIILLVGSNIEQHDRLVSWVVITFTLFL